MNRVMDVFQNDLQKAKIGAVLLLTSPGVPFIYYGEEIGMKGSKPDEDIRKPMQWDNSEYGGFSTFLPWRSLNSNFELMNVEIEGNDPESLLNLYKQLIHIRNESDALTVGEFQSIKTNEQNIVAYVRKTGNQIMIVIVNVGQTVDNIEMTLSKDLLTIGKYEFLSKLDSSQFPDLEIVSADKDVLYQYDSQILSGKFFLIELKKR